MILSYFEIQTSRGFREKGNMIIFFKETRNILGVNLREQGGKHLIELINREQGTKK